MGSIVVHAFITLDGVVQAPGSPDEDRENGFEHGGWPAEIDERDERGEMTAIIGEWENRTEALLLGRKTYELWAGAWGVWDENVAGLQGKLNRRYNRVPKHVASRTLTSVDWQNSHLLGEDVPGAAAELRTATDGEVRVWGSTELVRTLAEHDLIDEYRLAVYPIVLGTGKRLFGGGFPTTSYALTNSQRLGSGVVVNTLRRNTLRRADAA